MPTLFTQTKSNGSFVKYFLILFFFVSNVFIFAQPTWTVVSSQAPDSSGSLMLLLSDGSVLCKTTNGGDGVGTIWDKLTPDINGSYINGTWSRVCPMANSRLYFSAQTFKNGKVYVAGGEYGTGSGLGEIYDPVTNSWTQLPNTNNFLGDANSTLLEDGRILQASLSAFNKTLIYNPVTNAYSNGPSCIGGHDESTWLKLPDKSVLFVDIGSTNSERYIPATNQWIADANVPSNLYDPYGSETGPAFLLPDGRAFFMGSEGNTAFYTPSGNTSPGTWANGPFIPGNNGMPDAAGAMMVDGKIIFCAGPRPAATNSLFIVPTYYYEFNYLNNSYTQLSAPGGGSFTNDTAFTSVMLDLPDGGVMLSRASTKDYYIHKPTGAPLAVGKPTITAVSQSGCTNTFTLTGLLFNGICEGACYGDDWQMNTNFPIVRLTSGSNVYYARTYNWNRVGVQTGLLPDTTLFELPSTIPGGTYSLSVIANGNSSNLITFTFSSFPALTSALYAPDLCSGNNFTYNAVANLPGTTVLWTRAAVPGISNAAVTAPQASNPNETLINTAGFSKTAVYSYTLTNGTCVTYYKVSVVVHPAGTASITGNTSICSNATTTLMVSGIVTYSWSTGAFTKTISVNPSSTTIYTVSGNSYYGCLTYKTITVTVKPAPSVSIVGQTTLCIGESVILTASSDANNYNWTNGSNTNTVSVSPISNTTYSVSSSSTNGCHATAVITLSVQACDGIVGNKTISLSANVFPNPFQDKVNIECTIGNEGIYTFQMFDIFGRLVKEEQNEFVKGLNEKVLDLTDFSKGLYLLMLRRDAHVFKTKLIKE